MKKTALLLALLLTVCFCLCACNNEEPDYSDGDGNSELISMENKKVSDDDIEFNVVSVADDKNHSLVKTYKTDYTAEDFSVKFEKVKGSNYAYVSEEDNIPKYPEIILLPEYDLASLKAIMLEAYAAKYGEPLDETTAFVSQPTFATRNFTGKLVVTYVIYTEPTFDKAGIPCYSTTKRVSLTGDLYTFIVE